MFQEEIKDSVRQAYSAITTGGGEAVARRFYTDEELAEVPAGAIGWSLSVGNPVRYAFLRPGEKVLDVGSGGGIDTILAARRVGPEGRAIGLDILEEMCERGRRHATEAGVESWAEFVRGEMEDIPALDAGLGGVATSPLAHLLEDVESDGSPFRSDAPGGEDGVDASSRADV